MHVKIAVGLGARARWRIDRTYDIGQGDSIPTVNSGSSGSRHGRGARRRAGPRQGLRRASATAVSLIRCASNQNLPYFASCTYVLTYTYTLETILP